MAILTLLTNPELTFTAVYLDNDLLDSQGNEELPQILTTAMRGIEFNQEVRRFTSELNSYEDVKPRLSDYENVEELWERYEGGNRKPTLYKV